MSQQIKTLQTVLNQPADNCVALTYSLDLPFFEYMLFEPLYSRGCRNLAVLCDPGQHETALHDVPALEHLGRRYLCLPSTVARAAFHPKLILLTSEQEGLLLLGSGNLTRAGLTHNQEVWTRFDYADDSPDEFARAACLAIRRREGVGGLHGGFQVGFGLLAGDGRETDQEVV